MSYGSYISINYNSAEMFFSYIHSREENVRGVSNGKRTVPGRWIMKAHKVWFLGS
jgi:hypothetical protein